ncbi:MAG: hypothetical protein MJZ17_03935 [Bacteroidales bacterium]|nr:hypothetical protein [Bacteroidales bacterium]
MKENENISTIEPLIAYCPGDDTKSTFSKPREDRFFIIFSWETSSPTFILNKESFICLTVGIDSSSASGYVTTTVNFPEFSISLLIAAVLCTPRVDL